MKNINIVAVERDARHQRIIAIALQVLDKMTEEDVKKRAEEIFFKTEMEWVREKYKKYTRRYKYERQMDKGQR